MSAQSGRTRHEAEIGDGITIRLLRKIHHGNVGDVMIVSTSVGNAPIARGDASLVAA